MTRFEPADHLHSRTFIGLLIAQFLAAFNDQAIHASAMFFAINTETMTEARAISLMPILFYAPWAIFCTVAGFLADRYSKRVALVSWKVVEVGITLLALAGFWIGRHGSPTGGSWIVLSTVFLMGMHSAFFVPAKYGAMPEILTPRMLSKGNGVLESLSFLAVILGTVAGGVLSTVFRGQEYLIGVALTGLAIVGALASLFIERIPAANPNRPFPPYIYQPLVQNIRLLLTSRPLVFAVVGIAFFTFLVAFMRAVVYMHGQSQLPPWSEAQTSYIVGMVALGIGIGSPLVGWLSGGKVEVGLVPIGAVGMILATTIAAFSLDRIVILVACIISIGFFTGFYLVPLFSLLQHRAPKASKGDSIATSNFINITGAIAASLVFWFMDWSAIRTGLAPALPSIAADFRGVLGEIDYEDGHARSIRVGDRTFTAHAHEPPYVILRLEQGLSEGQDVTVRTYGFGKVTYLRVESADEPGRPVYNKRKVPSLLFLGAGAMTLATLLILVFILPDLFRRALLWLRSQGHYRLEVAGMLRLPASGPVVLVTDGTDPEQCAQVLRATDRVTRFVTAEGAGDLEAVVRQARRVLERNQVLALSFAGPGGEENAQVLYMVQAETPVPVLPVHHAVFPLANNRQMVYVVAGSLIAPGGPVAVVREELDRLRDDLARRGTEGGPLEREAEH